LFNEPKMCAASPCGLAERGNAAALAAAHAALGALRISPVPRVVDGEAQKGKGGVGVRELLGRSW
jgi:hypothetical protein